MLHSVEEDDDVFVKRIQAFQSDSNSHDFLLAETSLHTTDDRVDGGADPDNMPPHDKDSPSDHVPKIVLPVFNRADNGSDTDDFAVHGSLRSRVENVPKVNEVNLSQVQSQNLRRKSI
jgi:hypothetical protein